MTAPVTQAEKPASRQAASAGDLIGITSSKSLSSHLGLGQLWDGIGTTTSNFYLSNHVPSTYTNAALAISQ